MPRRDENQDMPVQFYSISNDTRQFFEFKNSIIFACFNSEISKYGMHT